VELEAVKCELAAEVLRSAGELRLRVTGASMLPAVWPGDELTIRRQPFDAVRPGRIVLVARDGRLCAHRVVAAGNGLVTTRGDALPSADPPAAPDQVLGAVVSVLRGRARLIPGSRVSLLALLLRHSDLCKSLLLRLQALRTWLSA
jgi:signal peptidase